MDLDSSELEIEEGSITRLARIEATLEKIEKVLDAHGKNLEKIEKVLDSHGVKLYWINKHVEELNKK